MSSKRRFLHKNCARRRHDLAPHPGLALAQAPMPRQVPHHQRHPPSRTLAARAGDQFGRQGETVRVNVPLELAEKYFRPSP